MSWFVIAGALLAGGFAGAAAGAYVCSRSLNKAWDAMNDRSLPLQILTVEPASPLDANRRDCALRSLKEGQKEENVAAALGLDRAEVILLRKVGEIGRAIL